MWTSIIYLNSYFYLSNYLFLDVLVSQMIYRREILLLNVCNAHPNWQVQYISMAWGHLSRTTVYWVFLTIPYTGYFWSILSLILLSIDGCLGSIFQWFSLSPHRIARNTNKINTFKHNWCFPCDGTIEDYGDHFNQTFPFPLTFLPRYLKFKWMQRLKMTNWPSKRSESTPVSRAPQQKRRITTFSFLVQICSAGITYIFWKESGRERYGAFEMYSKKRTYCSRRTAPETSAISSLGAWTSHEARHCICCPTMLRNSTHSSPRDR